jgi:competence protein ComEC
MSISGPTRRWTDAVARRPAVVVVLPLIAGILAQDSLPASPRRWLILLSVLILVSIWRRRQPVLCSLCLVAAIFLVGLISAQLRTYFVPANDISLLTQSDEHLVHLELRIPEPAFIGGGSAEMRRLPLKQIFTADATAIETSTGWQSASGKLVFTVEPVESRLGPGQTLRAVGWLTGPPAPANPGEFDLAAEDRRKGVGSLFHARRPETIEIVRDDGPSIRQRLRAESEHLLAVGFPQERMPELKLLELLVLGQSDRHDADIKQEFARTGMAYQLSISGLHIAIIGAATLLLMRLLRASPRLAVWIALAVVTVYAAIAQPTEAGMRALVMCIAAAVGLLARRRTDGLQLLAIAVTVILLIDPAELYNAGFQIGVAAVLGLILFSRRAGLFVGQLWHSDDPWADHHPPRPLVVRVARAIARWAWQIALTSAIAWVCVLPLVAYHFQVVSPWTVPGGVLMLPITVVALLAGVMKIVLTLILGKLAGLWAAVAIGPTILLRDGVDLLARLPHAGIVTNPPTPAAIVIYYVFLILPILPWPSTVIRRAAMLGPLLGFVALFAVPMPLPLQPRSSIVTDRDGLHFTLLSVGTGQTAVLRLPGGHCCLVDCGSSIPNVYLHIIQPYLRTQRVRRVDEIFLSQADFSDISAAAEVVQDFNVPTVCAPPDLRQRADGSYPVQVLLATLDYLHSATKIAQAGDHFDLGAGAAMEVLWPPPNSSMNSNNSAMVLKLHYAGQTILFPGDIQEKAIVALLADPQKLKADVLVAPHHGIAETRTAEFLRAVDPQIIVCSNDRVSSSKEQEFDRIADHWPVYRTSKCGAIDVSIRSDGHIGVQTFISPDLISSVQRLETAAAP